MPPIITARNVSKEYTLLHRLPYYTLRDSLMSLAKKPAALFRRGTQPSESHERFLALDDVSFSIDQGERVGIIGRNGAGKSTLLKILSQITPPSKGEIRLRGKVASLLEVGTGFNPELTGRENIFLNGAILGMKRNEVLRKFDEIVAFSEIEKFLDTPVKRYSSGMYVRLAFAVAAHLEPDILIVDEVLAVGDAQFQKKCLGKMEDVAGQGRTVLFVSHNMTALKSLCTRTFAFEKGKIVREGNTESVVNFYLQKAEGNVTERQWKNRSEAPGNESIQMQLAKISSESGEHAFTVASWLRMEFSFWNTHTSFLNVSVHVCLPDGQIVFNTVSNAALQRPGLINAVCTIPRHYLNDETYSIRFMVIRDRSVVIYDHPEILSFTIHDIRREGGWLGKWPGVVRPDLSWRVERSISPSPEHSA